jgi:hypothetical protein
VYIPGSKIICRLFDLMRYLPSDISGLHVS